jgi:hypothetical protein
VAVLQARVRSHSYDQALIYEDIAAIFDACTDVVDPELVWETAASEIRAALRLTRRAANHDDGDHQWTSPLGHTHTTSGRSP